MKVKIFGSFHEISGNEEVEIDLTKPIQVKELLEIIEERIPVLRAYIRREGDRILSLNVVLARGEEILKLTDLVRNKDEIKILPPIAGG
jgi:molybdopterin converting factor small subunit